MTAQEYNQRQNVKWRKEVEKWKNRGGMRTVANWFPDMAYYFFFTKDGSKRENGYMLVAGGTHFWRKTKRECVAIANRETTELIPL